MVVEGGLKGCTLCVVWQETGAMSESYFLNMITLVGSVIINKWF